MTRDELIAELQKRPNWPVVCCRGFTSPGAAWMFPLIRVTDIGDERSCEIVLVYKAEKMDDPDPTAP